MSKVTYGNFEFYDPQPIILIGDEPIFYEGKLDHYIEKITLIGSITGSGILDLATKKRNITKALANSYQILDCIDKQFNCIKPISIQFDDSNLNSFLPYSIEFESYQDLAFSDFFGVKDPEDSWSFSEEEGRVVKATHKVSSIGVKTGSSDDLLTNAKNFVNSKLNGYDGESFFFKGENPFLTSKIEEIDEFIGKYSITEEYSFNEFSPYTSEKGILSFTTQISYSRENGVTANLNGNIVGELNGTAVAESDFTKEMAIDIVNEQIKKTQSSFEASVYEYIKNGPSSYKYDINQKANTLNFNFDFQDPENRFKKEFTCQVSASKDSSIITSTINGSISYNKCDILYTEGEIENSERWLLVQEEFEKINLYAEALAAYKDFCQENLIYDDGLFLREEPEELSVTKNPFDFSISFSASYSNKVNILPNFRNTNISFTDTIPRIVKEKQEAVVGFVEGPPIKKIGSISVSASCEEEIEQLNEFYDAVESIFKAKQKVCLLNNKSSKFVELGKKQLDISFDAYYSN